MVIITYLPTIKGIRWDLQDKDFYAIPKENRVYLNHPKELRSNIAFSVKYIGKDVGDYFCVSHDVNPSKLGEKYGEQRVYTLTQNLYIHRDSIACIYSSDTFKDVGGFNVDKYNYCPLGINKDNGIVFIKSYGEEHPKFFISTIDEPLILKKGTILERVFCYSKN